MPLIFMDFVLRNIYSGTYNVIFWHPSKVLYTFFDHYPFVGAFSQKTVKYFWGHIKDADFFNLKLRII